MPYILLGLGVIIVLTIILRQMTRSQNAAQRGEEFFSLPAETRTGSFGSGAARPTPNAQMAGSSRTHSRSVNREVMQGCCFFCSRPALMRELTPVNVTLGGVSRRVLACPDDLMDIRGGIIPPVRAFVVEQRYVPWFAYSDYDPYVHYYEYGYDRQGVPTDVYPVETIEPQYWNAPESGQEWGSGYVFSPEQEGYRDFYSEEVAGAVNFNESLVAPPITDPLANPISETAFADATGEEASVPFEPGSVLDIEPVFETATVEDADQS
jgi:hypothetical protein